MEKFAYKWYENLVKTVFSDTCKRVLKSQLDMHKLTNCKKKAFSPLNSPPKSSIFLKSVMISYQCLNEPENYLLKY